MGRGAGWGTVRAAGRGVEAGAGCWAGGGAAFALAACFLAVAACASPDRDVVISRESERYRKHCLFMSYLSRNEMIARGRRRPVRAAG
ncbi:hypothetical protein GCM10023158_22160 [Gluconacetobacter tumulicola]